MNFICHHGVKGQKWGVRRGPPYPIGAEIVNQSDFRRDDKIPSLSYGQEKAKLIESEVKKYASGGPAGNQNCQLCTWSLECQFRGKNILPRAVYSPRDIAFTLNGYDIVKNPVKISIDDKNDVINYLRNAGDGSRFYTHVNWKGSTGGHEFITVNIGNKIYVADGQAGIVKELDSKSVKSYFDDIDYKNSFLVRMDDKKLNTDILKYNRKEHTTKWDWDKDISYMKEHGMISEAEAEAEEALHLKHSLDYALKNGSLFLWDPLLAKHCYKVYRFVQSFIKNSK